jgi:hypothetical protein
VGVGVNHIGRNFFNLGAWKVYTISSSCTHGIHHRWCDQLQRNSFCMCNTLPMTFTTRNTPTPFHRHHQPPTTTTSLTPAVLTMELHGPGDPIHTHSGCHRGRSAFETIWSIRPGSSSWFSWVAGEVGVGLGGCALGRGCQRGRLVLAIR